jgi:triosephosphate isomerase
MTAGGRRPLISGNWKMNLTHLDAVTMAQELALRLSPMQGRDVEVSIHPPFTALQSVQTVLAANNIPIFLGAQNVHWERQGAYTGEVSPLMLAELNVSYAIVGHSERRQHFGESDEMVNRKVAALLDAGISPIVCVGETLAERESGVTEAKVCDQVRRGLAGLGGDIVARLVLAYEPIWAIGTGRTATAADAQAVCGAVRTEVASAFGTEAAERVRIQYGGSVQAANVADLMAQPDIDGALVGGASLHPEEFAQIVAWREVALNDSQV